MKANGAIKNISYSFGANIISVIISAMMVMFLPKFLPMTEYGRWELFLFYFSYLGFLHFGWEDGIYLRYAGKSFDELEPKVFAGQIYGIVVLQIVLSVMAFFFAVFFIEDSEKKIAFICASSLAALVNFNNICNFIMQITNRIKDYAERLLTERGLLIFCIGSFLLAGENTFPYMYLSKVISLSVTAIICAHICRRLLKPSFGSLQSILHEASLNLQVGIKLMVANIASMLIIGIIRYGISMGWDVTTFGKVSLTLGVSNFLMVFINSIGVVLFPIVKRMDTKQLPELYLKIRYILAIVLFFALIFYYPLKELLSLWLPKYADSLIYMAVLFPVCLFESKVSLLINTYFKSLRKEALMLRINVISVLVSFVTTFFTVYILHNLNATIFSIVLLYAFRCELAEYQMGKLLHIRLRKYILVELMMVAIFILTGVGFNNWWAMVIYALVYIIYIIFNRQHVIELLQILRR